MRACGQRLCPVFRQLTFLRDRDHMSIAWAVKHLHESFLPCLIDTAHHSEPTIFYGL